MYVIFGRFPTKKAYGVTSSNTISALREIGFDVEISSYSDRLVAFLKASRIPEFLIFRLLYYYQLAKAIRRIKLKRFDLIWTRGLPLATFLSQMPTTKIIVEIHERPRFLSRFLFVLRKNTSTALFPISGNLNRFLMDAFPEKLHAQIRVSPMAVKESFLKFSVGAGSEVQRINPEIWNLAYVGRYQSNGHEQGIKELLHCVNEIYDQIPIKLFLFGISDVELFKHHEHFLDMHDKLKLNQNVFCVDHFSHDDLPSLMKGIDACLLPYPDGDFFRQRFPIKIYEYMALRKPIIATDTPSNREILREKGCFYFTYGDSRSFSNAILGLNFPDQVNDMIELNFQTASQNTYSIRTRNMINFAQSMQFLS